MKLTVISCSFIITISIPFSDHTPTHVLENLSDSEHCTKIIKCLPFMLLVISDIADLKFGVIDSVVQHWCGRLLSQLNLWPSGGSRHLECGLRETKWTGLHPRHCPIQLYSWKWNDYLHVSTNLVYSWELLSTYTDSSRYKDLGAPTNLCFWHCWCFNWYYNRICFSFTCFILGTDLMWLFCFHFQVCEVHSRDCCRQWG